MFDKLIDLLISVWNDFKPIVFVLEYRKGVFLRAGTFLKTVTPGWYFRIPFVDDYVSDIVRMDTMIIPDITITTFDNKTISIGGTFDLEVEDIYKALILTNDWRSNLVDISKGIISNDLEDRTWEEINKKTTKNSIEKQIQKRALEMGISIKNFNFTDKTITKALKIFHLPNSNSANG